MATTYTAKIFLKTLLEKTLDEPTNLTGMTKADEKNPDILLFSATGCEKWIPIPISLINEVEHLGRKICKDHDHPFVRINFKPFETPEAKMLSSLLNLHVAILNKPGKGFCVKWGSLCDQCNDPDCDACRKFRSCFGDHEF